MHPSSIRIGKCISVHENESTEPYQEKTYPLSLLQLYVRYLDQGFVEGLTKVNHNDTESQR